MPATKLPAVRLRPPGPAGSCIARAAVAVDEPEMHVDAVADPHAGDDRREGHGARPGGAPPRAPPRAGSPPGRPASSPGRGAMLISSWLMPYSGWISSTAMPACSSAPTKRSAKSAAAAERAQAEAAAAVRAATVVMELVLEARAQGEPRLLLEPGQRLLEQRAQAARPGPAVGLGDVAEHEALARVVGAEIELDPGVGVGHQQRIAERAERASRRCC